MRIVECVPNISEGRRPEIYHAVANAAASVSGVTVLNVDPGADTNRTVITFVGEPEAVLEGAFRLVQKGVLTPEQFRRFTFDNPANLYLRMNPAFFEGTRVQAEVSKLS